MPDRLCQVRDPDPCPRPATWLAVVHASATDAGQDLEICREHYHALARAGLAEAARPLSTGRGR